MEVIRSRTNATLKRVGLAARSRDDSVALLEGERLVRDALRAGLRPEVLLVREDRSALAEELAQHGPRLVELALFDRLGALKTSPGVIGLFARPPRRSVADLARHLSPSGAELLLGVVGVSDPGNLGALARCAEAVGASGILVAPGSARPFGPKALRGSMGSLLRLPVFELEDVPSAVGELGARGFVQCRAATRGGVALEAFPFSERVAVWLTGETGEESGALDACEPVTIPMGGAVESLNVTVAGALLLYEAVRRCARPSTAS